MGYSDALCRERGGIAVTNSGGGASLNQSVSFRPSGKLKVPISKVPVCEPPIDSPPTTSTVGEVLGISGSGELLEKFREILVIPGDPTTDIRRRAWVLEEGRGVPLRQGLLLRTSQKFYPSFQNHRIYLARGLLGTDPPGPHSQIRLAPPSSGVDLASN